MTTFTTEDRILAEKDGSFTINVEGSPPHIVDGGASVMIKDLTDAQIQEVIDSPQFAQIFDLEDFARAILKKARE
jgi:hypothetical protein